MLTTQRAVIAAACALLVAATALAQPETPGVHRGAPEPPEVVVVRSGALQLRALVWKPKGVGPFPAVLFNPGSGRMPNLGAEPLAPGRKRDTRARPDVIAPVFVKHGYVFMVLFRRGQGLSADQGSFSGDVIERERAAHGDDAANQVQVHLLETDQLDDALAGLAYLRARHEIDARRVAAIGHSFGGSLTMLLAERDRTLRAVVDFAGAANSWARSPELRTRLLAAVDQIKTPTFFIHASNDYSIAPGQTMAAESERMGRVHRLKIYPACGRTADDGHDFVYLEPSIWERSVFAFLDEHLKH